MQAQIFETDVLVIGAGLAGARAAIEAHDKGADVILTAKGVLGRDGAASWMAGAGYQTALYPPDSVDRHAKDTIRGGKYLNNQELVYALLELAPRTVNELYTWGLRLAKKDDKFSQVIYPGHTQARCVHHVSAPSAWLGPDYRKVLPRQVRRRERIKVMDDMLITDLLTVDDTVVGALGLDMKEGTFKVLKAKSTILATGGYMACYKITSANPTLTGDGHALAYRVGAKMMDMEFVQFIPYGCLWPPSVRGDGFPFSILLSLRAWFLNNVGERFMEQYHPAKDFAPREAVSRAIAKEVREGRGSPHGGAYFSLRHIPTNLIDDFLELHKEVPFMIKLKEADIDIRNQAIEVGPVAHYVQGGCWINEKCETSLRGLYAIGEVGSGGKDGADRLAGNSIAFCLAMGIIGGGEAAARAKSIQMPHIDQDQVEKLVKKALAPMEREGGVRPMEAKSRIRDMMSTHAIFARNEEGLQIAINEIERIEREMLPRLWVSTKVRRFNLEWVEALEAENMTIVSEMMLRSALMRKECRGLHEREDYPNEDPEWLKHILIRNVDEQMTFTTETVTFPYLKPGE
jgi:succinate dehydrogenase/fumarate reductase flavoprotein subunit